MTSDVLAPISLEEDSVHLLAAYLHEQQAAAANRVGRNKESATDAQKEEGTGWTPRLALIDGVPAERLAPLHGRLIARGLLTYQLLDRNGGIAYRLSPEGRSALAAARSEGPPPVDGLNEGDLEPACDDAEFTPTDDGGISSAEGGL